MLDESIRYFLQAQSYVFETDFLADYVERYGRKAPVHGTHQVRQQGAVAHAGIE